MLNQKGFASFIILAIFALLGVSFYAGVSSTKPLISNITKSPEPSSISTSKPNSPANHTNTSTNNQPEPYNAQKPYTSTTDADNVTFNGVYYIGDFDKTRFTIIFPKKGGEITGEVTGACNAKITGQMDSPDQDGDGRISGSLEGSCKPVPRFSFETAVKLTFEGMVHLNSGKIDVLYIITKPYSTRGYFNMYFNP